MKRLIASLLLALSAVTIADAQPVSRGAPILDAPWQEAMVSVRNFDPIYSFLINTAGYEEMARGRLSQDQIAYWRLGKDAVADFILLKAPGSDHGYIRLVSFSGVAQKPIRVGARAWDTGGYFSLMFRAKGLESIFNEAVALGFQAESEPIGFTFVPTNGTPPSNLKNVVLKAPDGINFAFYERIEPPLSSFWQFDRVSQPFNAMQMVANTNIANGFYAEELGMQSFWSADFIDPEPGYNNFGLPQNLTIEIPRRTRILWPKPGETGRLETMEFIGLKGRNLADRAAPPNLGILSVSYPVNKAPLAYELFLEAGGLPKYKLTTFNWPPYGRVQMFTVKAPDGALVDIFEPLDRYTD